MNSATSIKDFRVKADSTRAKRNAGDQQPPEQAEAGFRPMHFFVLASLMMATAAVILSRQATPEHLVLISLIVAAAGAASAGFYRMLAPFAVDDVSLLGEGLSERSRAVLEREKLLVLRTIKELEFDRAMGKVSPKDFEEMAGRLRVRALSLMKQVDEGGSGYRELIERELSARLGPSTRAPRAAVADPPTAPPVTLVETPPAQPVAAPAAAAPVACASCRTVNDPDAAFCKKCGTRLMPAATETEVRR